MNKLINNTFIAFIAIATIALVFVALVSSTSASWYRPYMQYNGLITPYSQVDAQDTGAKLTQSESLAITGMRVKEATARSMHIDWDDLIEAESYILEFKKPDANTFSTHNSNVSEKRITFLEPCTVYEFRIKAISSTGQEGQFSGWVSAKTGSQYANQSLDVTGLDVSNKDHDSVTLKWNRSDTRVVSDCNVYNLISYQIGDQEGNILKETAYNGSNIIMDTVSDLSSGKDHTLQVRSVYSTYAILPFGSARIVGNWSSPVSIRTDEVMPVPTPKPTIDSEKISSIFTADKDKVIPGGTISFRYEVENGNDDSVFMNFIRAVTKNADSIEYVSRSGIVEFLDIENRRPIVGKSRDTLVRVPLNDDFDQIFHIDREIPGNSVMRITWQEDVSENILKEYIQVGFLSDIKDADGNLIDTIIDYDNVLVSE